MLRIQWLIAATLLLSGCVRLGYDGTPTRHDSGGAVVDRGQKPDRARPDSARPDTVRRDASLADRALVGVTVSLTTPTNGGQGPAAVANFGYTVASARNLTSCSLTLNATVTKTKTNPAKSGSFSLVVVPDGKFSWKVSCTDSGGTKGTSPTWTFDSQPMQLVDCKRSGWRLNTKYRLTRDLAKISGDCFSINAVGVNLDGGNYTVSSGNRPDLWTHRGSEETLKLLRNESLAPPPGTSIWKTIWTSSLTNQRWADGINTADLDNDGDRDLIVPIIKGTLSTYRNNGNNTFSKQFSVSSGDGYASSRILDFNLDSKVDIFAAHHGRNEGYFHGSGAVAGFVNAWSGNLGTFTHDLDVADMDGDGRVDLLVGNNVSASLDDRRRLLYNRLPVGKTGGSFSVGWTSATSEERGPGPTFVGDLNGDGRLDLVLPRRASPSDVKTYIRLNNGSSGFKLVVTAHTREPAALADMDGDGDTDLVVYVHKSGNTGLELMLNNGKGLFTAQKQFSSGTNAGPLVAVDLNGDGRPDLVRGASSAGERLSIWRNATAAVPVRIWTGTQPGVTHALAARDMDGDGDLDLVESRSTSSGQELVYHVNSGSGTMASTVVRTASGSERYRLLAGGDMDGTVTTGVQVTSGGTGVAVRNFKAIRGFTRGLVIAGTSVVAKNITVQAANTVGVLISGATGASLSKITVNGFHHGVGLRVKNAVAARVDNSSFCPTTNDPQLTTVSAYCTGNVGFSGTNNKLLVNNGCKTLTGSFCR